MRILSVDLAYTRYAEVGIVILEQSPGGVSAQAIKPCHLGLTDPPVAEVLAECLAAFCDQHDISIVLIDGPQGWKHPDNGLAHSRVCEHRLHAPGKTGLPGRALPRPYLPFMSFSVAVFEALTRLGFGLFGATPVQRRLAVESYPYSAWKRLGLTPLPSKTIAKPADVVRATDDLRRMFGVQVPTDLTHDELQALVVAFAGIALAHDHRGGYVATGVPPTHLDGTWREGFIVNPTRDALGHSSGTTAANSQPAADESCGHIARIIVGVMGPGEGATAEDRACAEELGGSVAREGWVLLTGGRDAGVMAAATRGARCAGGLTLGILPGDDAIGASPDVDIAIVTGLGQARNNVNVLTSHVVIACGMGLGTAAEIALALKAGRPVVLLRTSDTAWAFFRELGGERVRRAVDAREAIALTRALLTHG